MLKKKGVEIILKAKIKLLIVLIVTAIFAIYGIELGTRILISNGKIEYLIVDLIAIALLLLIASRFYRGYKTEKRTN
jgi:hypothetical protein